MTNGIKLHSVGITDLQGAEYDYSVSNIDTKCICMDNNEIRINSKGLSKLFIVDNSG